MGAIAEEGRASFLGFALRLRVNELFRAVERLDALRARAGARARLRRAREGAALVRTSPHTPALSSPCTSYYPVPYVETWRMTDEDRRSRVHRRVRAILQYSPSNKCTYNVLLTTNDSAQCTIAQSIVESSTYGVSQSVLAGSNSVSLSMVLSQSVMGIDSPKRTPNY